MVYKIQIKRVYDLPEEADGIRILVDRLWPRGISKERAALDRWDKEIAPSPELRKWYCHKANLFPRFHHNTQPSWIKVTMLFNLCQTAKRG